jgi:hypothetical protein
MPAPPAWLAGCSAPRPGPVPRALRRPAAVSSPGKTIGFDDVYVTLMGTNTATANVALDVKGGFLYGVVTTTDGGKTFSGKVTGGTGAFKGATGTITGKVISSTKTAITIIYS